MSEITIHGFPQSSYVWTARAICAAKGLDVKFVPISPPQSKQEDHLARHPYGKVPAFAHGDFSLFETSAIGRYVDAAFEGPALQPADIQQCARMEQWISVVNSYLYPEAVLNFILAYVFPGTEDGSPDATRIDAAIPKIRHTLSLFNEALGNSPWLVGETPTLADYFFVPLLFGISHYPAGKPLVAEFENLGQYIGRVVQVEAIMKTAPSE